jgi:hypothetical protein
VALVLRLLADPAPVCPIRATGARVRGKIEAPGVQPLASAPAAAWLWCQGPAGRSEAPLSRSPGGRALGEDRKARAGPRAPGGVGSLPGVKAGHASHIRYVVTRSGRDSG